MFRRFLIAVLIFLLAVLVAADRLGAIVAGHVLAGKLQTDEHLDGRPDASIGGFPFLTQAISGKYSNITVKANDVVVNGLTVSSLTASLHGVHIRFSKALRGSVSLVPVDRVSATALVSIAEVNTYLSTHSPVGQRISIRAAGGTQATVVDRLRVGKKTAVLQGVAALSLSGNEVKLGVSRLQRAPSSPVAVGAALLRSTLRSWKVVLPLRGLPFRVSLNSVTFSTVGVTVTGTAANIVLGARPA